MAEQIERALREKLLPKVGAGRDSEAEPVAETGE